MIACINQFLRLSAEHEHPYSKKYTWYGRPTSYYGHVILSKQAKPNGVFGKEQLWCVWSSAYQKMHEN